MPKEPTPSDIEARLAALEARNRELEAEVARLRRAAPPAPKQEPHARTLPGQGAGLFDRMGNRVYLPGQEPVDPASTTVGGNSGLGSPWRTDPDGTRRYMPDGVERDPATGEAVARASVDRAIPTGPARTPAHQANVDFADRLFPVTPAPRRGPGPGA